MSSTPKLVLAAAVRSSWVRGVLGVAVVAAAFAWALPLFAPYREVFSALGTISPGYMVALAIVGVANLIAPSTSQKAALPELRLTDAVTTDWATSAVTNTVPGGSAIAVGMTWSMYRSFGLRHRAIAQSIVVTGVWDTFVKLGTPLLALAWLSTQRPISASLVQAAIVGAAMFAVVVVLGGAVLAGPAAIQRLGLLLNRLRVPGGDWPDRLDRLRHDLVRMVRRRWRPLTFWTLVGHANLYVLLVVCLRAVGAGSNELSLAAILAAFAFGRLVTALPISPGGLGVMELGLTGALAAVGRAPQAAVVAAVLLFRALTFVAPIPLGAVTWLVWTSRTSRSSSQPDDANGADAAGADGTDGADAGQVALGGQR